MEGEKMRKCFTKFVGDNLNKLLIVGLIIFSILQSMYIVYWGNQKVNFHLDEFWTYDLSNNIDTFPSFIDGKKYSGFDCFQDYLMPSDDSERFNYKMVVNNQSQDVHPPLYYFFIHTICSFSSGQFSMWYGIGFNIFCIVVINFLIYGVSYTITKDKSLAFLIAIINGTSIMTINTALYIRMYALKTVFILAISWLYCWYYNKKKDRKFWILTYFLTVCCVMTHYYTLVYLFFLNCFYGIKLLMEKNKKELVNLCIDYALAGVTCIALFPSMLMHIFAGPRGRGAVKNMLMGEAFLQKLIDYVKIIDKQLFHGCVILVIILGILFIAIEVKKNHINKRQILLSTFESQKICLLFSAVCYIMVIAKIAPYRINRYIMAISWIFLVLFICELSNCLRYAMEKIKVNTKIIPTVVCILIIVGNIVLVRNPSQLSETYTYTQKYLDIADQYSDQSVIYVYDDGWKTMYHIKELEKYKDFMFVKKKAVNELVTNDLQSAVVYVCKGVDETEVMSQILGNNPNFIEMQELYKSNEATVYYVD